MKIRVYVFAVAALMAGNVIAGAQSYQTSLSLPGITGATIYTGAPEGFDPISASASELDAYGYPPRPDPGDAEAYAAWVRAVSTTRVTPQLIVTNRYHGPIHKIGAPVVEDNTSTQVSTNWSGYVLTSNGRPPFTEVFGQWYVPNIGATTKTLNGTPFAGFSSEWAGIDGDNSSDVIQDGTEADFYGGSAHYNAWFEFYPEPEMLPKGNFPVAPGDLISAYSWEEVVGGKVTGKFYMTNLSTKISFSTSLTIPAGASFSGNSAEWIVERTTVNGSDTNPLPFYAMAYMNDAWTYKSGSNTKILYSTQPNVNIKMNQGSTLLSSAFGQDSSSMWFQWHNYF